MKYITGFELYSILLTTLKAHGIDPDESWESLEEVERQVWNDAAEIIHKRFEAEIEQAQPDLR